MPSINIVSIQRCSFPVRNCYVQVKLSPTAFLPSFSEFCHRLKSCLQMKRAAVMREAILMSWVKTWRVCQQTRKQVCRSVYNFSNLTIYHVICVMQRLRRMWALSIQPKIPVISVGTSYGTDHFGLAQPEYSGPALKVVHFDRSGHFGRSDRNVPFRSTNLLSPVPLFRILLTKTITKHAVAWVGSV